MTAPTEEYVSVNGVRLYTRSVGTGPEIVVLHGGPGAHHDYLLPQFDTLATRRRLRYYDQRGGGRSSVDREVAVGWQEQVADLDALMATWNPTPRVLLGYSWGALLAMLYAVHHPVDRLALVSPAPVTAAGRAIFQQNLAARTQAPALVEEREALRVSGLRDADPDAYRRRMFELSVAGYFADPANARNLTPFRVTGRTQTAVWDSLGDYDLTQPLAQLSVPALVVHGARDPIPVESAQEVARHLDAPFVLLDDTGHVPYVEAFDGFHRALDDFLPRAP